MPEHRQRLDYGMASRPIQRKMVADIREAGGLELVVYDALRNGDNLAAIAKPFGVNRSTLWRYLKQDPARYAKYQQAQKDGAAGMVDKGQDLLASAADYAKTEANSAHVQAVRNQADYLKWQAGVTDRKSFGSPEKQAELTVTIEHLHLAALQASGGPEPLILPAVPFPPERPAQENLDDMTPIVFPLPSERKTTEQTNNEGDL